MPVRLRRCAAPFAFILLLPIGAQAQSPMPGGTPPPPGMSLAASAAMRFPQPVRVGDLIGRQVLRPTESQQVLGRVYQVVRNDAGEFSMVISFGGWLGLGSRLIAVPVDAMVLLGQAVEVVAYKPRQLRGFASFVEAGSSPVPDDAIIRVGLAKPSH